MEQQNASTPIIIDLEKLKLREPSRDWVDDRRTYLGSTDIAAILGLHPYSTPMQVYLDNKGLVAEKQVNERMIHGQNLEVYVQRLYSRVTGRKLHKSRLYRLRDLPFLGANPDYEVRGERPLRLVECKCAGYFGGQVFGEATDAVPDQYLVQCMWQLAITGWQVCDLALLVEGNRFMIYTIDRDEALIRRLIGDAKDFWHTFIEGDMPPPVSGEKADTEFVNARYPTSTEEQIYATPEVDDLTIALRDTRQRNKEGDIEQKRLENLIKQAMGEAGILFCSPGKITWKSGESNGTRTFRCHFKEVSKLCQEQQPKTTSQAEAA